MSNRREFLKTTVATGMATAFGADVTAYMDRPPAVRRQAIRPVAIASRNGEAAVARAMEVIQGGGGTMDAVVDAVNIVELDPEDMSVGYGGLPNFDGVVQLDASVMEGPTRGAGAVGALEGIKTPSRVALMVMRYTDHVFLVGKGAQEFAVSMGFEIEDLLTDDARRRWLEWRHGLSPDDDFLELDPGRPVSGAAQAAPGGTASSKGDTPRSASGAAASSGGGAASKARGAASKAGAAGSADASGAALSEGLLDSHDGHRPWGTINCDAIDPDGNLSGVTTTSGLAYKIPGRVGDSPIIGAGLYVDNDVGAAGSTGRGEAVIKTVGSHTVVENMRRGMSPADAALEALRRVVSFTVEERLLDERGQPAFNVNYYALDKQGRYGGAALWSGAQFVVNVDGETRVEDSAYLFER